jgi:hypothetical protein
MALAPSERMLVPELPPSEMMLVLALSWDLVTACYWAVLVVVHLGRDHEQDHDPRSPQIEWLTWQALLVVHNQFVHTKWLVQDCIVHVSTRVLLAWFDPLWRGVASWHVEGKTR